MNNNKIIRWLLSNDTGVSSKTLCGCLYGILPADRFGNYPSDPDDFGRCKRFLAILSPKDKTNTLQRATIISPEWKALVKEWDLLEKMYNEQDRKMYQQMRKIIGGAK